MDLKGLILEDKLLGEQQIESLVVGGVVDISGIYNIPEDFEGETISHSVNISGYYEDALISGEDSFTVSIIKVEYLEYKVKYFIDDVEQVDLEVVNKVLAEKPVVQEISIENIPEGYILDEEKSTKLPFEVSEEGENVIEVYYIRKNKLELTAADEFVFPTTTEAFILTYQKSNNDKTEALLSWMNDSDLYIAISSQDTIDEVTYNNEKIELIDYNTGNVNYTIRRATSYDDDLIIKYSNGNEENLGGIGKYAIKANTPKHRWSVVKISGLPLTSQFILTVKVLGDGHHLIGKTVYVENYLTVYHQYGEDEETPKILDEEQSGSLENDLSYSVQPRDQYNGEVYELVNAKIEYNDDMAIYVGASSIDGYLTGTVPTKFIGEKMTATAVITFIYRRVPKGKITIKKEVSNHSEEYKDQVFDIFIEDENRNKWTVSLKNGEYETIEGLAMGTYTISEIVPMNYENIGIQPSEITLTREESEKSVVVTNKRTNDGWFYDDDEKKNNFTVGVSSEPGPSEEAFNLQFTQEIVPPPKLPVEEDIYSEDEI